MTAQQRQPTIALTRLTGQVLSYIIDHPGVTGVQVARKFRLGDDLTYGWQKATASTIAALRRRGFLRDCPRCPVCKRALSRHHRNVPLHATILGERTLARLRALPKA